MKLAISLLAFCTIASLGFSRTNNSKYPTWWNKYQNLAKNGPTGSGAPSKSLTVGINVDVSNECGPQSETYIAINSSHPRSLSGGSNEIFRLPMRGYFSSDGGSNWEGVDLPLPPQLSGTNDTRFGSDPSLVFDTSGNLYYSYIAVFFWQRRRSKWVRDGSRPFHRWREDLTIHKLFFLCDWLRSLQRQTDDHRRYECEQPVS